MIPRRYGLVLLLAAHGRLAAGPDYADETSCIACHRAQTVDHHSSAHARTSAWPTEETVKGNFAPGSNAMTTSNPTVSFLMERERDEFFQIARIATPLKTMQRRERIGLVMGSGRKAQTYLYWNGDLLMELPVSFWMKTGEWMNSPGYIDGTANFDRGVSTRCLECHATSFENLPPARHRFRQDSVVPGISCQKCHGPAAVHVDLARKGRITAGQPTAVVNPAKLSRTRQMDLCALCHGGVGQAHAPPLSYRAGEILEKYLSLAPPRADQPIDPHGSQLQGLLASRCYRSSDTMTCSTCHDGHRQQRDPASFAQSCLSCHQPSACGQFATQGAAITTRCIDCHMPLTKTAKIVLRHGGQRFQPEVRNHRIGIYPAP